MTRFKNRICVVTGGAKGIGEAMARRLAAEGGAVMLLDLKYEEAERAAEHIGQLGGFAEAYACDVSDEEAVRRVFAEIEQHHGRVDVLVNNAGTGGPSGPIEDVALADWQAINAQALITGAVAVSGDQLTVKFRLYDVFSGAEMGLWGMSWEDCEIVGFLGGVEVARRRYAADPLPTTLEVAPDATTLDARVRELKEELFTLRFQSATGQLESHGRLRAVRKDIARIYTVLQERELGIVVDPEADQAVRESEAAAPAVERVKA